MLSNTLIGIMLGAGVGAWVYSKTMHKTGNNTKNALIVSAIAALFAFIAIVTVLAFIK